MAKRTNKSKKLRAYIKTLEDRIAQLKLKLEGKDNGR